MNKWKRIIESYCHHLQFERTKDIYGVNNYRKTLTSISKRYPFPLSLEDIRDLIGTLNRKRIAPATVNHYITILNSFMRWCQLEKNTQKDFSEILNKMRPYDDKTPDPNDVLTVEQVKKLLLLPVRSYDYPGNWRVKNLVKDLPGYYHRVDFMYSLLFELLYKVGARSGEVVKLKKKHLNFDHGIISFYETKTGNDRHVPIPPDMEEKIKAYVQPLADSDYLFSQFGKNEHPLSQQMANMMFKSRAKRIGIDRSVHIHMLRHTAITHLLVNGAPLPVVQAIVGHRRLNTTQLYTHILVENQREVLLKYNPLIRSTQDIVLIFKRLKQTLTDMKLDEDKRLAYQINETDTGLQFSIQKK